MYIDYDLLHKSQVFYEKLDYKVVETPWIVDSGIANITKPKDAPEKEMYEFSNRKFLVASGEQSFLEMFRKGYLPKGKYQTITPCFRDDTLDEIHVKQFMKNELIITGFESSQMNYTYIEETILKDALQFFKHWLKLCGLTNSHLTVESTGELSINILYKGIELGSYGFRSCQYLDWLYGTGLAEPRFSQVLRRNKNYGRLS